MLVSVVAAMSYLAALLGQFKQQVLFNVLMIAMFIETLLLVLNLAL